MLNTRQSIGGLGNQMFMVSYILSKVYNREVPDRYVQDYRLWVDFKHHIRDYWRIGIGPQIDKVGIHIRRGDYLKATEFHSELWLSTYYEQALKEIPRGKYLVFCMDRQNPDQDESDRDWCRENLPELLGEYKRDWELAPIHEDEVEDMNLMAQCKYLIGANSSFSWMAAFIGEHEKVVFPAEQSWFVDKQPRVKLLPEWTQINI